MLIYCRTSYFCSLFFFFNDTATTEIYTLSLHDALPISRPRARRDDPGGGPGVSALPIYGEKGEGRGTLRAPAGVSALERTSPFSPLPRISVRGAGLSDVPALEALMAPYVATGDLLPRSNYDLCRHVKEYMVADAPDAAIVGSGSLKIYSRDLA